VSGHSTIIKLEFKRMPLNKRSFNVRLTSDVTKLFPDNQLCSFKVQIPTPIQMDRSWKVAINSISCPTEFSTFLNESKDIDVKIGYRSFRPEITSFELILKRYHRYSKEQLISDINKALNRNNVGNIEIDERNFVKLTINIVGVVTIGESLANILNLRGVTKLGNVEVIGSTTSPKVFKSTKPIDLDYYRPTYFIVYSNLVQNSIIGNNYSRILRVIPFQNLDLDYKIFEFKQREYYPLANDTLNIIEIYLKTHDGQNINF